MSDEVASQAQHAQPQSVEAMKIVKRNMLWSVGAGILPFPLLELVAITAVELKLVKGLADHYGMPYRRDLARAGVISLLGSLGGVTLGKIVASSSLRVIPLIGPAVAAASLPAVAAGVTYAVGKVFITHFEAGGTLLDFDPQKVREYFRAEFQNGMKEAEKESTKPGKKLLPA